MDPLLVQPLAVCGIYLIWDYYRKVAAQQQKRLRERVTFMLWQAAHEI
jgi:hypothetical protein